MPARATASRCPGSERCQRFLSAVTPTPGRRFGSATKHTPRPGGASRSPDGHQTAANREPGRITGKYGAVTCPGRSRAPRSALGRAGERNLRSHGALSQVRSGHRPRLRGLAARSTSSLPARAARLGPARHPVSYRPGSRSNSTPLISTPSPASNPSASSARITPIPRSRRSRWASASSLARS